MSGKFAPPSRLLWVDLEMTGLDPKSDLILEIAAVVTDFSFKKITSYEAVLYHERSAIINRMEQNTFWKEYPENRDEFLRRCQDGILPSRVEEELVNIVQREFKDEPAVLAGNSIHSDRGFIRYWWPKLNTKLHYRMLDVSSLKVYMQGKYGVEYEKKDVHRAFDDIQASIAEWQYYIEWLKNIHD